MKASKALRVVVVEDDPATRFMMSELCEAFGLSARVVPSAHAFLDLMDEQPDVADVILMDIHMPRLSGADATLQIRQKSNHPPSALPVVAVTADPAWADADRRRSYGIDGYLKKPVDPREMVKLVEALAS